MIDPSSHRRARWLQVLGTDAVRIESPIAVEAVVDPTLSRPGVPAPRRVERMVRLDVLGYPPAERAELLERLSVVWGVTPEWIAADIADGQGVPIILDGSVKLCRDPDEGRAHFAERRIL